MTIDPSSDAPRAPARGLRTARFAAGGGARGPRPDRRARLAGSFSGALRLVSRSSAARLSSCLSSCSIPPRCSSIEVVRTIDLVRERLLPGDNPPVVFLPGPFAAADFDELTLDVPEMPRGQMVASWEGRRSMAPAAQLAPIQGRLVRQARSCPARPCSRRHACGSRFRSPTSSSGGAGSIASGAHRRPAPFPYSAAACRTGAACRVARRALPGARLALAGRGRGRPSAGAAGHPGAAAQPGLPATGATRLELSIAACPANRQAVELRIVAGPAGDATGGREIWRGDLWPPATPRWQELQLELGQRLAVGDRLRVEVDGPAGALVYLADPVFLAPVRRRRAESHPDFDRHAAGRPPVALRLRPAHLARAGRLGARRRGLSRAVVSATTTLPSHTSLFTGLESIRHGVHRNPAPPGLTSLAAHLRSAGWRTMARTGGGYLHPHFGLNRGFERYSFHRAGVDRNGELATGMATVRTWLEELRDEPFFLFLHTYEVHGPYRPRHALARGARPGRRRRPGWPGRSAESSSAATGYRVMREGRYIYRGEDPNGPELGAGEHRRDGGDLRQLDPLRRRRDRRAPGRAHPSGARRRHRGGRDLRPRRVLRRARRRRSRLPARQQRRWCRSSFAPPASVPGGRRPARCGRSTSFRPFSTCSAPRRSRASTASRCGRPWREGRCPVCRISRPPTPPTPATGWRCAPTIGSSWCWTTASGRRYRGATALFDVGADPAESRDLHADHPRTAELARRLLASWARVAPGLHLTLEVPGAAPSR